MFLYVTNELQLGTDLEGDLIEKVERVEYNVTSFGAFLRCARYGLIGCLVYPCMVSRCGGGSAMLYVPLVTIKP